MYLIEQSTLADRDFVQTVQSGLVALVPAGDKVLALPIWRKGKYGDSGLSQFGQRVGYHEWVSLYGDTISIQFEYRIITISVQSKVVWQKDEDLVHGAASFLEYLNSSRAVLSWGFTAEQYRRMKWLIYESGALSGHIVDLPDSNPSFLVVARDTPSRLTALDWNDFPISRDCYIYTKRITVCTGLPDYPVFVDGDIVSNVNKLRAMFD